MKHEQNDEQFDLSYELAELKQFEQNEVNAEREEMMRAHWAQQNGNDSGYDRCLS